MAKRPTFDFNDFIKAPVNQEITTVTRGGVDFTIRRLNGAEKLHYNDLAKQGEYACIHYVLSVALLSGEHNLPLGKENAALFIERYGALAERLYMDVFELTNSLYTKEIEVWEEAKKNSASEGPTNDSKDSTADGTA